MNGSDELLTTKQRMQYILESRNVSVYDLCSGGGDRGKVGNQIYKDTALTEQTIQLFLARFTDVSADWLLRGHGPTYLPQASNTYITNNGTINGAGVSNGSNFDFGVAGNQVSIPTYDPKNVPTPAELGLAIKDITTELRLKSILFAYEQKIADLRKHIEDLEINQTIWQGFVKSFNKK
jgi:hypothetical protein